MARFPYFVISLGNLTWGGTGKTTLISQLAHFLQSRGVRVAVVSRGYGRKSKGARVIHGGAGNWRDMGDEMFLLSQSLPQASFAVAENRREALDLLAPSAPQVVLLDDAFQHRSVARDLDIVLIDATENLVQQKLIPFGKLRESRSGLRRADAVVLTHAAKANAETEAWIQQNLLSHNVGQRPKTVKPVFRANYTAMNPERWKGRKAAAFCALGSPRHFFRLLRESGADLVAEIEFRDHHEYAESDLQKIEKTAREEGAEVLLTTPKDAVKLQGLRFNLPLIVANAELQFEPGDAFYNFVASLCPL